MQRIQSKLPIIGIAILAFIVVAAIYFFGQNKSTPTGTPAPSVIEISNVPVRNFEANPVQKNNENDSLIVDNDQYQIVYVKQFNQFIITVNSQPFETVRQKAEAEFIKNLNITKDQACKLDVKITTTTFANPDISGNTYPLSFCK